MRTILLLLLVPLLAWAEPATIVRNTELKKSPATDAPTLTELAAIAAAAIAGVSSRPSAG